jgi:L-asparaginase / beta-aspartyl-peptidase
MNNLAARIAGSLLACVVTLLGAVLGTGTAQAIEYRHFQVGDLRAPTPSPVSGGLLLVGGGDRNHEALRWFVSKAGGGHLVVLRASQTTDVADEFYYDVGGVASVETFVFTGRSGSYSRKVLRALERADGIFIAGGDQSRYVRFWRGTPVERALEAHVARGRPLGGTSAGLAILGQWVYGAMDGGSLRTPAALADPLGPANTIETGFLGLDLLRGIVTDTHFKERDRLGRLLAFVAKSETLAGPGQTPVWGLGVDESAAVTVEPDGTARVHATDPGGGLWLVRGGFGAGQRLGTSLSIDAVDVTIMRAKGVLDLRDRTVEGPQLRVRYTASGGTLAPVCILGGTLDGPPPFETMPPSCPQSVPAN